MSNDFPTAAPPGPPPTLDPSLPLESERDERCAQLRVSGMSQVDAWRATTKGGRCSQRDATCAASKLFRKPLVAARLAWLMAQKEQSATPDALRQDAAAIAPEQPRPRPTPAPRNDNQDDGAPITRDEAARILAYAARSGETTEAVSAIRELRQLMPELFGGDTDKAARPDPAHIVAAIAGFAGLTGDQVAAQLGGWRLIREKLCAVLRVSNGELLDRLTNA